MKLLRNIIFVFLFATVSLWGKVKLIEFFPPLTVIEGQDVKIQLRVNKPEAVSQIIVSYRTRGTRYRTLTLSRQSSGYFVGYIPGQFVLPPRVELFIYYIDRAGRSHSLFGSAGRPFKIIVNKPAKKRSALEEEFELFQAEDVVVSAARHLQKATKAPAAITVLDKEFIRTSGIFSLAELLKFVPGMDVYQFTPGYYIVGARGMADESNNMSLVLLDGMELNNQMFGIAFSEVLPVSLHDVQRIEVIRGPGSALYGANAFSTVINIISIDPDKDQGYNVESYVGNYDSIYSSVSLSSKKNENLSYSLSGMYRKSRAYDKNKTGFESKMMRTVIKYKFYEGSELKLSGGLVDADAEIFSNLGEIPTHGRISYLHASYKLDNFRARVYWSNTYAFVNVMESTFRTLMGDIYGTNNVIDGDFLYSWEFGKVDRLITGVNLRYADYYAKIFSSPYTNEFREGIYLQNETYPWDWLNLTVGVRADWNSWTNKTNPAISPKVCLIITPWNNNSFRISYSKAFLKPSFYQNKMRFPKLEKLGILISNPDLENEQMTAYELGYAAKYKKHIRLNIDLFYNLHRKAIQFSGTKLMFLNTGNDRNYFGGEISIRIGSKYISGFVNYSYLRIKNVNLDQYDDSQPEHTVNLGILGNYFKFSYAILAHYISTRYVELTNPIKGSLIIPYIENQELGNYVDLDMKLSYLISKNIEVGFYGQNLVGNGHREFAGDDHLKISPDLPPETFGGSKLPTVVMGFVRATF